MSANVCLLLARDMNFMLSLDHPPHYYETDFMFLTGFVYQFCVLVGKMFRFSAWFV